MIGSVDAHVHLWNRATDPQPWIDPVEMRPIDRDFGTADLDRMLTATGVDVAVVVQAGNSWAETGRLLAGFDPRIAGVVGWIDLAGDVPAQLDDAVEGARARNRLVGIRHLAHLDPDPSWLIRPEVGAGFTHLAERDLGFDLVLRAAQLPLATSVVAAHPGTRFVLDHLGGIAETDDEAAWTGAVRRFAGQPNTYAKISGLARFAHPDRRAGLRRSVDVALEAFGPQRLMYGSDWPLSELGAGAPVWREAVSTLIGALSPSEQSSVRSGTATAFYRLDG